MNGFFKCDAEIEFNCIVPFVCLYKLLISLFPIPIRLIQLASFQSPNRTYRASGLKVLMLATQYHGDFFWYTPLNLTVERVDIDTILRACHFIGHIKKSEAIQRLPFKRLIFGCLIERPLLHENKYQPNVEHKKQTKSEIISQAYWLWVCCELIGCFMRPNVFI